MYIYFVSTLFLLQILIKSIFIYYEGKLIRIMCGGIYDYIDQKH